MRYIAIIAISLCSLLPANGAVVNLPIEVVGGNGATASVAVEIQSAQVVQVRSLWLQIHNLSYEDMASVQVNNSDWLTLNNKTVTVAEPGKSFGGIGGGFSTLKMTLPLPEDAVSEGTNTVRFRFNRSDGLISGFRVLAFNFLDADSRQILVPTSFAHEDPNAWRPPLPDSDSIRAGKALWQTALLTANPLPDAGPIRARCADCHAYDGRDLKYFNFSNASIVARSQFHGLSELEGRQIASYIRSLKVPNPGRPWNPPYQPGPGIEAQPVVDWSAGAGLEWALDDERATLSFLFPTRGGITAMRSAFRPDGNVNPREVPISLQLPDWSHWLPRIHPLDAWGSDFQKSDLAELYDSPARGKQSLRSLLAGPAGSGLVKSGRLGTQFEKWRTARRAFLKPFVDRAGITWSADLSIKAYSTQLWQLVKTWELTQEFALEGRGRELFGPEGESRTWLNAIPAGTAPAAVNIPDGPAGIGGSSLTNEYFNSAWYQLQVLLNSGNHSHRDRSPVDWIYLIGSFQDLYRESHRPEPARLLVTVIKALQSTDPRLGPEVLGRGWRPNRNVDPTIMVSDAWASMLAPIPVETRRELTEAFLASWLEKNRQYALVRYFRSGSENNYGMPPELGWIYSGKVWEAAALFTAAGVNPAIVKQLQQWGADYISVAARLQYSPGSPSQNRNASTRKGGGQ